jgi:murein DD-endopeptidase MepM/ murein hydrolase activator NlpD
MSWFLLGGACGIALGYAAASWHPAATQTADDDAPASSATAASQERDEKPTTAAKPQSAAVPAPEAKVPDTKVPDLPASISMKVGSGDTLISMLTDTGVSYEEANEAVAAIRKIYDPRKLDIGAKVAVDLDPSASDPSEPILSSLSLPVSKTTVVKVVRSKDGEFSVKKIEAAVTKKLVRVGGPIIGSFYETGAHMGVPADMLTELIKAYSYDIDFQRDIKRGHSMEIVLERMQTADGAVTGYGNVVYAALNLNDRQLRLYRYTDKGGNTDYYNEKGESLRKALLKTPINGARLSSGFGMRMHPVLGYSTMHRGIDFAAPVGTPIYAAGDGTVEMAGPFSSYGNYVRVKHNDKYATAYAHASRIASGVRPGMRVKQGQVIAYVGTTGRSTGPHLHYEILVGGTQVNPSGVKFKTGNMLAGAELSRFKNQLQQVQVALKAGGKQVASR